MNVFETVQLYNNTFKLLGMAVDIYSDGLHIMLNMIKNFSQDDDQKWFT